MSVVMHCVNCNNEINAGMEISLNDVSGALRHCPHCLQLLPLSGAGESEPREAREANVSVGRFERRRRARERFVDALRGASNAGGLACPACAGKLNTNDELALRNGEQFHCPHCQRDLAEQAYRQVAYDERRWLPLIDLLRDLVEQERCADCAYLGAVASACHAALSSMSQPHPRQDELVTRLVARSTWRVPDCDWAGCEVVKEYRKLAAEGIDLL